MPCWAPVMMILVVATLKTTGECPATCECKWKSGKESVICNGRNLTEVPQHLDTGTQLIDLSGNNLTSIREDEFSTARLLNLQKVFLSHCSIRTLHRSSFRNLNNLVDLDLSYNLLTSVPSHTFESILELMELKLNGNPIGAVRNNSFKSVPHLNKLDLSECRIAYIELNAFSGLEMTLEWLKLDKNRLVSIKPLSITILGNLHGLELAGNPWNCSCGLRPLREWVLRHNIPHTISPICRSPDRIAGRIWDKLELDDFACLPRVAAVSQEKSGQEGANITMSCIIRSVPNPTVRWLKKERVIANLSGLHSGGHHLFTVQVANTESNLTISSAEMGDTGDYVCRAENKAGKAEARIHLEITLKPEEPPWSTKVVVATAAVIVLFSLAAVLLIICICCLWKRQRSIHRHGTVQTTADTYEMNHKATKPYEKVIRSPGGKWMNDIGRGSDCRNGYISGTETDHAEDGTPNPRVSRTWGASNYNEKRDKMEGGSPDLHIPRLKDLRLEEPERSVGLPSTAELLASTPMIRAHILRKEDRGPNRGTLYTSCSDANNYPDLLESDKNTLPRRGYKSRRPRTGSCGSESMSPLLQGSSDESCDSTPMPLLDIPDPYPELDKFLKEYRNLQEQLYKMKESCENLKQDNLRFQAESGTEPKTISRLMDDVYKSADVAPMFSMYNTTAVEPLYSATSHSLNDSLRNVLMSSSSGEENNNPRVEEQVLDIQSGSYWVNRSTLLNTLSGASPRPSFYDS